MLPRVISTREPGSGNVPDVGFKTIRKLFFEINAMVPGLAERRQRVVDGYGHASGNLTNRHLRCNVDRCGQAPWLRSAGIGHQIESNAGIARGQVERQNGQRHSLALR